MVSLCFQKAIKLSSSFHITELTEVFFSPSHWGFTSHRHHRHPQNAPRGCCVSKGLLEGGILLWVQDFQQRGLGVEHGILGGLIDLAEVDDRNKQILVGKKNDEN